MLCKKCNYLLKGLTEHRCPECGNPFDPDDPSTWESDIESIPRRRAIMILRILLVAILLFIIAAIIPLITTYHLL